MLFDRGCEACTSSGQPIGSSEVKKAKFLVGDRATLTTGHCVDRSSRLGLMTCRK